MVTDRHLPPSHYVSIGDAWISQAFLKYELASFPLAHKKWPNMLFYQSSPQNSLVTDRHLPPSNYVSIGDAKIFAISKNEIGQLSTCAKYTDNSLFPVLFPYKRMEQARKM